MTRKRVAISITNDKTGETTYFGSKVVEVKEDGKITLPLADLIKAKRKLDKSKK